MENKLHQILSFFPNEIKNCVEVMLKQFPDNLEEIRIRVNKPISFLVSGKETPSLTPLFLDKEKVEKIFHMITNYSYYSIEHDLQNGFITVPGGHRIGICGKAVLDKGRVKTLMDISSLNFRIARQKKGIADKIMPYLVKGTEFKSTIILSPPNCGKTTLLRDIVRILADDPKYIFKVGVVDERSEIAGCYGGVPQLDVGVRTDVLDSCPKRDGIIMMIRSMSPHIIATDELGKKEDIEALEYAITAGVKLLTTVHGTDYIDLIKKPYFDQILSLNLFKRLIILSNKNGVSTVEDIVELDAKRSKGGFIHG